MPFFAPVSWTSGRDENMRYLYVPSNGFFSKWLENVQNKVLYRLVKKNSWIGNVEVQKLDRKRSEFTGSGTGSSRYIGF